MRNGVCKYFVTLVMIILSSIGAFAESESMTTSLTTRMSMLPDSVIESHHHFKLSYRVNRYNLDSTYMANKENIDRMRVAFSNPDAIDSIVVYSFASPEGPLQNNLRLARGRGDRASMVITDLLNENGVYLDDDRIIMRTKGENWEDLRTFIERNYKETNRDKLLSILDSDMSQQKKKQAIRRLGWKTWRFIIDKVMPHLRSAEIVCYYHNDLLKAKKIEMPAVAMQKVEPAKINYVPAPPVADQSHLQHIEVEADTIIKRTRVAVKTNMLYDAAMWTNYSVEVPFKIKNQQFSVTFDHQFSWWRWGKHNNQYSNRYFQIGGEARWWFAPQTKPKTKKKITRDCLAGHFVGAYFVTGKYDFQWQRKICYQGELWSVGVTYGYSMPISSLFNLEFSISAGYAPITYRHYFPADDYSILFIDRSDMGTKNYIGVTKASVSLVMPLKFKHKVTHKKKIRL